MKFCSKCGNSMEDDARVCPGCGEAQEVKTDVVAAVKGKLAANNKLLPMIAGAAVGVIVLIVLLVSLFTPGYKKAAKKFCKAFTKFDVEKMIDLMPDFMYEDLDKDEIRDMANDMKSDYKGISISYVITDSTKMDAETRSDLEDHFDTWYDKSVKVKDGYYVHVKFKMKKDGEKDEENLSLSVIKIGSEWKVYTNIGF